MLKSFFKQYLHQSSKKVHMRPGFQRELDEMLFSHPPKNIFLSSIFNLMKRYSFPALAGLAVLVFGIITFFPKNSVVPLGPEEVLAKALENYEEESGSIHHEKVLNEVYRNGEWVSSSLTESYQDDLGNSVFIDMNSENEEVESIDLTRVDEFGDVFNYTNEPVAEGFFGRNVWDDLPESERKKLTTLRGEKNYCVEKWHNADSQGDLELLIAQEDDSTYIVRGGVGSKKDSDPATYRQDLDALKNLNGNSKSGPVHSKKYITHLIENAAYDYSQVEERGNGYHLFKVPFYLNDSETWFYINNETYQLSHYETYGKSFQEGGSRVTFLINEFIDDSERSAIFDPNRFEQLEDAKPIFEGYQIPFEVESSGCFDHQGNRLQEGFFNELSPEIRQDWDWHLQSVQSTMDKYHEKDMDDFDDLNDLPFDPKTVFMPSRTNILQGYEKGIHESWNFSGFSDDEGLVYTPLDGTILEVSEGWNQGYGNSVLIAHEIYGLPVQTHYGHLHDFSVEVGDEVEAGQPIARMGQTGNLRGGGPYFLNFELRYKDQKLDPTLIYVDGALKTLIESEEKMGGGIQVESSTSH